MPYPNFFFNASAIIECQKNCFYNKTPNLVTLIYRLLENYEELEQHHYRPITTANNLLQVKQYNSFKYVTYFKFLRPKDYIFSSGRKSFKIYFRRTLN